jgi:xylulokinase
VVAAGAAPLEVERDASGRAEQRVADWLAALQAALAQVPANVRAATRAIGVSGQQHGLVAVDSTGAVLAPVKLWCDTSTQAEADAVTEACGGRERAIAASGNPVLVGYTASKIRWLAERHPRLYRGMARILLPHDFINFVLTGVAAMEHGDASGTGLLDVRTRQWSPVMLRAVDPRRDLAACLPPLLAPDAVLGTTSDSAAALFGLPAGVPVAPGGGDNMMAAIGTGNVTAGRLTISLGTSGTLFAHADAPVVDERGNIAAFCGSTGGWLPLLCTMNCTFASELMRHALGIGVDRFDETLAAVPAGAEGLLALPFFAGERTPDLPRATASLLGLAAHNCTAAHLLRATVEGATYGLRFGLDELRRLGMAGERIVLTGGGARSRVWSQVVADVCGLPVTQVAIDEGASFGAALQALWVLRRQTDPSLSIAELVADHVRPRPELGAEPRAAEGERYERGYVTYRRAVAEVASFSTADA